MKRDSLSDLKLKLDTCLATLCESCMLQPENKHHKTYFSCVYPVAHSDIFGQLLSIKQLTTSVPLSSKKSACFNFHRLETFHKQQNQIKPAVLRNMIEKDGKSQNIDATIKKRKENPVRPFARGGIISVKKSLSPTEYRDDVTSLTAAHRRPPKPADLRNVQMNANIKMHAR